MKKLFALMLALVLALSLAACGEQATQPETTTAPETTDAPATTAGDAATTEAAADPIAEMIGYSYTGQDPWGAPLNVTLRTLENGKLEWTYAAVIGEGEDALTLDAVSTDELKDGAVNFHITGKVMENEAMTFDYSGTLQLKDGKVVLTYADGQITEESPEGGSGSYHVGALDAAAKTVTLEKAPAL